MPDSLPATPDRSRPPELGPPPALSLPPLQRLRLGGGLEVVLLEKHEVPLVEVELLVRAGSAGDPAGREGLAELTAALLDKGAGGRGALEIAEAVEFLGAELQTWSDYHDSGVRLFAPVARLADGLPLLADVALRPEFAAEELDRQRRDRLTELLRARDEPRTVAAVQLDRALYGDRHPYGRQPGEASLRSLAPDDLRAFHRRHYRPDNAVLLVVGDVTAADLLPLLQRAFAGWAGASQPQQGGETSAETAPDREVTVEPETAEQTPVEAGPAPGGAGGRRVYLVDMPGAAQSEVRVGRVGAPRDTPDYFPLTVMNTVLGASFTSRLNSNLREDKGYAYGAYSRFRLRRQAGPFFAGAAVQTDATAATVTEILRELEAIRRITPEELERARNYAALTYPRRFQSVAGITDELAELVRHRLAEDFFNSYVERVLAVGREEAEAVAARWIDPEDVAVVVVGDRAQVEAELRALGIGPVETLTVEDVLGPAPRLTDG